MRTQSDAVIHAGELGFYDDGSYERLSDRELRLLIVHSSLPWQEKNRILGPGRDARVDAARESRLVNEFQSCLEGESALRVLVYACVATTNKRTWWSAFIAAIFGSKTSRSCTTGRFAELDLRSAALSVRPMRPAFRSGTEKNRPDVVRTGRGLWK